MTTSNIARNPEAGNLKDTHVLVVEDNPGDFELTRVFLEEIGFENSNILHAENLRQGFGFAKEKNPSIVLLDLNLEESKGLDTLEMFLAENLGVPVVVLTGNDEETFGLLTVSMGAQEYLCKDKVNAFNLRRCVRYTLERSRLLREKEQLVQELRTALKNVQTLKGILPICSKCKSIRDDAGYWKRVEEYISEHTEADFSHGMCPVCLEEYYEELKAMVPGFKPPRG